MADSRERLLLLRNMLLLLLVSVLSVDCVPVNQTHNGSSSGNATSDTGVILADLFQDTDQNVTSANDTEDMYSTIIRQLQDASAETLAELNNDTPIEEGDIMFLDSQEDRNAVNSLWFGAVVPYSISPTIAGRQWKIQAALKMISEATCIRFKEHTNEANYIAFQDGPGCASYVGVIGGRQPLFIASMCGIGNICHEIIHALGFHHEHTRQDREQYIDVKWSNILQKRKRHFKNKYGNLQNLPYDLSSIMHYGPYFFTKAGGQTLVPKVPGSMMGQRSHLSPLDMERLNRLYCR